MWDELKLHPKELENEGDTNVPKSAVPQIEAGSLVKMSDFKAEKSMFTAFYKNVLIIVQTDQEVCSGKF